MFDLRDSSVLEFSVPYLATTPWRSFTDAIGTLTMIIVDPLQAPGVVAPSINFMVEVAAADDFELGYFVGPRYAAITTGTTPLTAAPPPAQNLDDVEPQAGSLETAVGSAHAGETTGERYTSVKQLIMIPHMVDAGINNLNSLLPPFYFHPLVLGNVPPQQHAPKAAFSASGNIATCYLYARGGTDHHIYNCAAPGDASFGVTIGPVTKNDKNNASNRPISNTAKVMVTTSEAPAHVRVPGYSRVPRVISSAYNFNLFDAFFDVTESEPPATTSASAPAVYARICDITAGTTTTPFVRVARSAADDGALGHYMGPAPLFLPGVDLVSTWYDYDTQIWNQYNL